MPAMTESPLLRTGAWSLLVLLGLMLAVMIIVAWLFARRSSRAGVPAVARVAPGRDGPAPLPPRAGSPPYATPPLVVAPLVVLPRRAPLPTCPPPRLARECQHHDRRAARRTVRRRLRRAIDLIVAVRALTTEAASVATAAALAKATLANAGTAGSATIALANRLLARKRRRGPRGFTLVLRHRHAARGVPGAADHVLRSAAGGDRRVGAARGAEHSTALDPAPVTPSGATPRTGHRAGPWASPTMRRRARRLAGVTILAVVATIGVDTLIYHDQPGTVSASTLCPIRTTVSIPSQGHHVRLRVAPATSGTALVHLCAYTVDGRGDIAEWTGTAQHSTGEHLTSVVFHPVTASYAIGEMPLPHGGDWRFTFLLRTDTAQLEPLNAIVHI
jgi:hypothetical protein